MAPVEHRKGAKCPEILKFIETLIPDIDDRITLIDIIASGAYRKDLAYIAFLLGHGSSGSSTFIQLIQALYGSKTTEAVPLKELLDSRFALSNLKDARYSIGEEIDEVNETGTSTIKRISGGDWISADQKNRDRARFRG
jgi:putative DNA primase/helicase